jgi:SagB-type dehydrogenase family enzyme
MLRTLSRMAFRGGSYFPLFPTGVHSALIRPFWVLHHVSGMDDGLWFYQATEDSWCLLRSGDMHFELQYLTMDHPCFSEAAAVCVMVAAVQTLMLQGGPDTYRLAHLEAGTAENRLSLAARGLGLANYSTLLFYDEDLRKFLGLTHTAWEPLVVTAIGVPPTGPVQAATTNVLADGDWRG